MTTEPASPGQAALSELAAALEDAGWGTQLRDGFLHIVNRSVPAFRERITVQGESYVWSWGEPIAALDKTAEVVEKVAVVLTARIAAEGAR